MSEPEREAMRSGGERARAAALAGVKRGDRLDLVTTDGVKYELVVTDDPHTGEDGMVSFTAADAEANAEMERLGRLVDGWGAARDRRDADEWEALARHADAAEASGGDVRFEFATDDQPASADAAVERLEAHHRRGRERTDHEAAVLAQKMATGGLVPGPAIVGEGSE